MPTYDYYCEGCDQEYEFTQKITEDAMTTHLDADTGEACGPMRRLLSATPSIWKGGAPTSKSYV